MWPLKQRKIMKKLLLNLLILTSTIVVAQELPSIPLKNGFAYYTFEHKLDNTAKCLSYYFDGPPTKQLALYEKLGGKTSEFSTNSRKLSKQGILGYFLFGSSANIREYHNLNCNDTLMSKTMNFQVSMNGEFKMNLGGFELFRKKLVGQSLTANINIVFINKNEYKLIIKDVVYAGMWMKGAKIMTESYKLGELYTKAKESESIDKETIKFFSFMDMLIKKADQLILESLTDTYMADEL